MIGVISRESDNLMVACGILQTLGAIAAIGFSIIDLLLVAALYILMRFSKFLLKSMFFLEGVLVITLVITLLGLDNSQLLELGGTPLEASEITLKLA